MASPRSRRRQLPKPAGTVRETARSLYYTPVQEAVVTADLTVPLRVRSARLGFASDAELAEYLGVDKSRITRWKRGERPEPVVLARLVGLEAVVAMLQTWLAPEVVADWLAGNNAQLGHVRPLDALRAGRLADVMAAIQAEQSGAFA